MSTLWRDGRFYLLLGITLILISLAYQVRLPAWVDVGAFGDRAYLWASPLQSELGFNGDEHLIAEGYNYRWTKATSWVHLPDMAWHSPLRVKVRLRGWRPPRQNSPWVEVRVNGVTAGRFQTSGDLEVQTYEFETYPGSTPHLEVLLETRPFSPGGEDKRLLGVQLDWVRVDPLPGGRFPVPPPGRQLLLWGGVIALLYAGLRHRIGRGAFWWILPLTILIPAGLAFRRHWLTPFATWALILAGALFLLAHADVLLRVVRWYQRRARSLPFFAALIGGIVVVGLAYIRWAVRTVPVLGPRPDAVLLVIFVAAAILYALLTWERPLQRLLARLDARLRGPWLPGLLLAIVLIGVTLYEFDLIRDMQFIGHADYADNGVVARNLLAGRGFVVDYVTQFFRIHPGISHPQETWPLLQPVLIAPAFALLGNSAFAAKVPNLVLQLALAVALYVLGSRLFDRRVGLVAVLLTLLNRFILRLIIFPTSDLAFTLFALLALGQFFWASERERKGSPSTGSYIWAGVWAGLMALAKPNGVLFAGVVILWDLVCRWRDGRWQGWWRAWLAFGLPAGLLFAPWVGRNLVLFGEPVHSTERFDAWILKYQEWEEIYRIYFDDLPNRSWLLRYGFDRVTQAIGTEFRKWWTYLSRASNALLTLTGSALALLGLLSLRRRAVRLFSLAGGVFVLFGSFICIYWHVEERYFVPFIPWMALLTAYALWRIHDTLAYSRRAVEGAAPIPSGDAAGQPPEKEDNPGGRKGRRRTRRTIGGPQSASFGWLGLVLVVLACRQIVAPFPQEAAAKRAMDNNKQRELQAYRWLAEHSEPDEVIMTRVPWQVTYYTDRRTVMIPQDGLEDTRQIAELYGVDYLFMDGDARGKRAQLNQALQHDSPWALIYDQEGVQIYSLESEP